MSLVLGIARKLHGGDAGVVQRRVVLEVPVDAESPRRQAAVLRRLDRLLLFLGEGGQHVHGGKPGGVPVLKVLQDPLGAVLQRLQDRRGIRLVLDFLLEPAHS